MAAENLNHIAIVHPPEPRGIVGAAGQNLCAIGRERHAPEGVAVTGKTADQTAVRHRPEPGDAVIASRQQRVAVRGKSGALDPFRILDTAPDQVAGARGTEKRAPGAERGHEGAIRRKHRALETALAPLCQRRIDEVGTGLGRQGTRSEREYQADGKGLQSRQDWRKSLHDKLKIRLLAPPARSRVGTDR